MLEAPLLNSITRERTYGANYPQQASRGYLGNLGKPWVHY